MKIYRSDPAKCLAENKRKRDARKSNPNPLTEEELLLKRENDRQRKAKSQKNQSQQKIVGTRIKDQNWKQKAAELSEEVADSTIHVHKHREQLKVVLNFSAKSTKRKVAQATESITKSLSVLTPQSKVKALTQTCLKKLSPALCSTLSDAVGGSNPLLDVYIAVKRKRDPASNCAKHPILITFTSKTRSANKVRRSTQSLTVRVNRKLLVWMQMRLSSTIKQ